MNIEQHPEAESKLCIIIHPISCIIRAWILCLPSIINSRCFHPVRKTLLSIKNLRNLAEFHMVTFTVKMPRFPAEMRFQPLLNHVIRRRSYAGSITSKKCLIKQLSELPLCSLHQFVNSFILSSWYQASYLLKKVVQRKLSLPFTLPETTDPIPSNPSLILKDSQYVLATQDERRVIGR